MDTNWMLYLLENTSTNSLEPNKNKKTYLGVTVDIERRLRQHNGELVGGAKYTKANKGNGIWVLKKLVKDLTKSQAFSYESLIKYNKNKGKGNTPVEKRIYLINNIIHTKK